jgi:dTDP-4-dehydrorhamnose reductase
MVRIKIMVTGAGGQLGRELQQFSQAYPQFEFIFLSKRDLPIDQEAVLNNFFESVRPDFCINCAAYTAVDKAEKEKHLAFLVNGESVGWLASACAKVQAKLIHISTDYVFDGSSAKPLKEEDKTSPINVYGASKLLGEELATLNNPETLIIRTAWVYSEFGSNFVKTMIKLMSERDSVNVVDDQIGSPTYAADLAEVIMQIMDSREFRPGIYHYSNDGRISWYEFAKVIREQITSNCRINPIPSSQYPAPAKRPFFSLLDKTKIKSVYHIHIKDWKTSLDSCLFRIKRQSTSTDL